MDMIAASHAPLMHRKLHGVGVTAVLDSIVSPAIKIGAATSAGRARSTAGCGEEKIN
jgi:hypothetical protein